MAGPLIHIGYHKTGTTWLQQHLFSEEALGFGHVIEPSERPQFSQEFILENELDFEVDNARKVLQDRCAALEARGKTPVISAERLSGAFQAGGYDSAQIANRLKAILPNARILIVIREQRSMLFSAYVQYVRGGGPRKLDHYFRGPRRAKGFLPSFGLEHFQYDRLVYHYQQLFGKEQVLVLPYEIFRKDPKAFTQEILGFCDLPTDVEQLDQLPFRQKVNQGYSAVTLAWKRRYNRNFVDSSLNQGVWMPLPEGAEKRFVRTVQGLEKLIPAALKNRQQAKLKQQIDRKVKGVYGSSNFRLQILTGLDLARYDYDLKI
ncbi:MAG: sulfotransferase [Phaeodactylibacter sp.]|nr:sulfotransferase [Phaeodactylibacter sp.]